MKLFSFKLHFISFLIISCAYWSSTYGSIADSDLTLSSTEKQILDQFKSNMDPLIKDENLKKEVYLIRWLRATKFDIRRAEDMLLEHMRWRKDFKMDTIHNEDWSDFERMYEYTMDSIDKEGKPLAIAPFAQWDFRRAIVSGHRDKMERYILKFLDEIEQKIRNKQNEGKLVTRGSLLINVEGFNTIQHGCVQCLTLYVGLAQALDAHFPFLYEKMILVNTPSIFEIILNVIKPALQPATRDSLIVYGTNKRQWQSILLQDIDEDQLPVEYGGTKISNY